MGDMFKRKLQVFKQGMFLETSIFEIIMNCRFIYSRRHTQIYIQKYAPSKDANRTSGI